MRRLFWRPRSLPSTSAGKVLLLVDWENLFICLISRFGGTGMHIEDKLQRLIKWVKEDIGELLGGCGFVFAPEHLSLLHQQICVKNGLKLMTCPKRQLTEPRKNPKTGKMGTEEDTVDETIIWFTETMVGHPDFKTICLVTGDSDYVPMLKEMRRSGIRIAIAAPTINSLARSKELIKLADINPKTQEKMLLMLDKM